jgi:cation transport ATPase
VTRLASIEEMAGMNMLCSDKTGTLTLNKMVIQVRVVSALLVAGFFLQGRVCVLTLSLLPLSC